MTRSFKTAMILMVALAGVARANAAWRGLRHAIFEGHPYEQALRDLKDHCASEIADLERQHRARMAGIGKRLSDLNRSSTAEAVERRRESRGYQKKRARLEKRCAAWERKIHRAYRFGNRQPPGARRADMTMAEHVRLRGVVETCEDRYRQAWTDFYRARKRATRTLESLHHSRRAKTEAIREERRKLEERLARIQRDCRKRSGRIVADARDRRREARRRDPVRPGLPGNVAIAGRLSQFAAYRTAQPEDWTVVRSQLLLEQTMEPTGWLRLRAVQRAWYDAAFDLTDRFPEAVEEDEETELELREAFADISLGPADLRLGKQTVVWGEALGFFIADVVNARDLRDFILPDFEWIRIPQWGADLGLYMGPLHFELVALLPEMNRLPKPGSEFFIPPTFPPATPVDPSNPREPERTARNGEYGGRLSWLIKGWDVSAFVLYGWDKTPVYELDRSTAPALLRPRFHRQTFVGASTAKDFSGTVVKGEVAVRPRARLQDDAADDAVSRHDTWEAMIGVDRSLVGPFHGALEVGERRISGFTPSLRDERRTRRFAVLSLRADFFQRRLRPDYLLLTDLDRKDRLHRPSLKIQVTPRALLTVGMDIFSGSDPAGVFGRFESENRAYGSLSYSF